MKKSSLVMVALSFVSSLVLVSMGEAAQPSERKSRESVMETSEHSPPALTQGKTYNLKDRQYKACTPVTIHLGDELGASIDEILSCNVSDTFGVNRVKPGTAAAKKIGSTCTFPPNGALVTFHCKAFGMKTFVLIKFRAWQADGKGPIGYARFLVDCI